MVKKINNRQKIVTAKPLKKGPVTYKIGIKNPKKYRVLLNNTGRGLFINTFIYADLYLLYSNKKINNSTIKI